jgi:hypothetical protein
MGMKITVYYLYTVRRYSVAAVSYLLWDRNVYGWVMLHEINVRHVYFYIVNYLLKILIYIYLKNLFC